MGFFVSMSDAATQARDWGHAVVGAAMQVKDWTVGAAESARDAARDKVQDTVRGQAARVVRNRDLLAGVDRRQDFNGAVVQPCPQCSGLQPLEHDGLYLGQDCMKPTPTRPAKGQGHKPRGCESCGKQFEQVVFSNGIDNSLQEACDTLQQMADDLCLEVVGIYNASYKSAVPPVRSAEEDMALFRVMVPGQQGSKADIEAGIVGLQGALKSAGSVVAPVLGPWPLSSPLLEAQDVLDVIDTLAGRSLQPASQRMASHIAAALREGLPVKLIGHSEGGVNTVAAIADAQRMLVDKSVDALLTRNPELSDEAVNKQASQEVEAMMAKNLYVTLLGTQQTGLPSGPNYTRVAHRSDIVPAAIAGAQDAIGKPGHADEPSSMGKAAPPVERFPRRGDDGRMLGAETLNPVTAHSMQDSYIPYLRDKAGRAPGQSCC